MILNKDLTMQTINLNGLWDFVVDLDPKYHQDKNIYPKPPYVNIDSDRRYWMSVEVPGVWNKYAEKLDIYEGVCWYAREFTVDDLSSGGTALLRFGAVNYACRVFVNGELAGIHEGGYTEFTIEVSGKLHEGKNFLAVEVDNRATSMRLPVCLGYFNYGGIHRDVKLEIYDGPYLQDVFVDGVSESGGGQLRVRARTAQWEKGLQIRVGCEGKSLLAALDDELLDLSLDVEGIDAWCPDSPRLYEVTVEVLRGELVVWQWSQDIGFRRIEMTDGKVMLNGESIFLKGICYLYDSPVYGCCLKSEQFDVDIALLKDMGINTIRSHFPFTHELYRACDRAGIMVWIEPPIYCLHPATDAVGTPFSDPGFVNLAHSMVEEMILHARCHPSVIIFGIGNECNVENAEAERFFGDLVEKVRSLDDTRLLSYASLYCNVGPLASMIDVLGINEYWGWYDKIFGGKGLRPEDEALQVSSDGAIEPIDLTVLDDKLNELKVTHKQAMLLTEFGADSVPGYLSRSRDLWSEDYHADLLRETYAILSRHDEICGAFPFCFCDYRDPSKILNGYWDGVNYKGVVSYKRRAKKPFYVLRDIYQKMK